MFLGFYFGADSISEEEKHCVHCLSCLITVLVILPVKDPNIMLA